MRWLVQRGSSGEARRGQRRMWRTRARRGEAEDEARGDEVDRGAVGEHGCELGTAMAREAGGEERKGEPAAGVLLHWRRRERRAGQRLMAARPEPGGGRRRETRSLGGSRRRLAAVGAWDGEELERVEGEKGSSGAG